MLKKVLISLGLLSVGANSAASDYNGQGSACVANGYGYCPSTQVCFYDQSLPTPNPGPIIQEYNNANATTKSMCAAAQINTNFTTNSTKN